MKRNKKRRNYFDNQKQRFGENFLQTKNAQQLQYDAIRIFQDMSRGNIDVRDYEQYFKDTQLIESCIFKANEKCTFHTISANGVCTMIQQLQYMGQDIPVEVNAVFDFHQKAAGAFSIISTGFYNYKMTGNIEFLLPVVNQIRNYRNYIKE